MLRVLYFLALSAGCILYVVVFEVLQRERAKTVKPKIIQFIALAIGFCALVAVEWLGKFKYKHQDFCSY